MYADEVETEIIFNSKSITRTHIGHEKNIMLRSNCTLILMKDELPGQCVEYEINAKQCNKFKHLSINTL